ncbi:MAG: transketolase [Planctomycetota bacterium]
MWELKQETCHLAMRARHIRRHIVEMLAEAGSGHPGGSLSSTDILVALYFGKMRHDPANPNWPDRDRFVLSKGHSCPALYAVLAECGYFDHDVIHTLRKFGSILQGHPDSKRTPGINISSGSLGQGLSAAIGMAIAARLDGRGYRSYVLLGDGEVQEGQVWEAAMTASHYKLDNLCAILDYNGLQIDGPIRDVMNPEPLPAKWLAFGWHVIETSAHDFDRILAALDEAERVKDKPTIIVASSVKGRGVSFMENVAEWHGKAPTKEQAAQALAEMGGA